MKILLAANNRVNGGKEYKGGWFQGWVSNFVSPTEDLGSLHSSAVPSSVGWHVVSHKKNGCCSSGHHLFTQLYLKPRRREQGSLFTLSP